MHGSEQLPVVVAELMGHVFGAHLLQHVGGSSLWTLLLLQRRLRQRAGEEESVSVSVLWCGSDADAEAASPPHQLFHLAAGADEQPLVEAQGRVDGGGVQLQLSSLCGIQSCLYQHYELINSSR